MKLDDVDYANCTTDILGIESATGVGFYHNAQPGGIYLYSVTMRASNVTQRLCEKLGNIC